MEVLNMYIARDYITNLTSRREVVAIFKNGRRVTYTTDILNLLFTDREIDTVYDLETGEVIFCIL